MTALNSPNSAWSLWDMFANPVELHVQNQPPDLPLKVDTIRVHRDDGYGIEAVASGAPISGFEPGGSAERARAGSFVLPFDITAADGLGRSYLLSHCHVGDGRYGGERVGDQVFPRFQVSLSPFRIRAEMAGVHTTSSHTEWYLNGPHTPFLFARHIQWSVQSEYRREIQDWGSDQRGPLSANTSAECAFVSFGDRQLLVFEVPQSFEPAWAKKIGIEYRENWGGIPEKDERIAISDIVSFVLGRHLLHIGSTTCNTAGWPFLTTAFCPRALNPRALSRRPDEAPIALVRVSERGLPVVERDEAGKRGARLEGLLSQLVPLYLTARKIRPLDLALERYLVLPELYLGVDLPIMRTVLDILARHGAPEKGPLARQEVSKLLADELTSIERKLDAVLTTESEEFRTGYVRSTMDRLRRSFDVSMTGSFRTLYREIGLPVGPIEGKAIQGGSAGAHAISMASETEVRGVLRKADALRTLLNRVILKIVGYDGTYTDRSSLGWPERGIDQPMQGTPEE